MSLPRPCVVEGCAQIVTGPEGCPVHTVKRRRDARYQRLRRRMLAEHPYCSYCGSPGTDGNRLTLDHVVPLSQGGSNDRENLTVACDRCNKSKKDQVDRVPVRVEPTVVIA
jgi:5-methylcytosine-specific restriction endonuclease McrA